MRRAAILLALLAAGCGGARQGADEPEGEFKVEVVSASLPRKQRIAQPVELKLRVRNADTRTLPNVAVTVETEAARGEAPAAFGQRSSEPSLADSLRPIWVLAEAPAAGTTASPTTWSAGTLGPGESRVLTWKLVAARAGRFTLGYRVSPGLSGRARAAGDAHGSVTVTISDAPVAARIGDDGSSIRGD